MCLAYGDPRLYSLEVTIHIVVSRSGKRHGLNEQGQGLEKDKASKKDKSQKKKDIAFSPEELAQSITQAARSMRTALSHNLATSGLYAGPGRRDPGACPGRQHDARPDCQKLGVKAPTMTRTIGRMEAQGFVGAVQAKAMVA